MDKIVRDSKGKFVKGVAGNKGGRPKVVAEIRQLAQESGLEAFNRVVELTRSKEERVALAACQEILNRAYGKPEQAHKVEGNGLGPTVIVVKDRGDA